jgi:hypothetical protein
MMPCQRGPAGRNRGYRPPESMNKTLQVPPASPIMRGFTEWFCGYPERITCSGAFWGIGPNHRLSTQIRRLFARVREASASGCFP